MKFNNIKQRFYRFRPVLWSGILISLIPGLLAAGDPHGEQNPASTLRQATAIVDGGYRVHYRTAGSGPPLLMLHGFTLTGEQWLPFAKDFSDSFTVIIADLPGHGGSSPQPGAFSFAKAAQIMHGLLDALEVDQVFAAGHSGGGITLLHMAAQQPQRMAGMAIIAGPHYFSQETREIVREDKFEYESPAVKEFYRSIHPGGQAQVDDIFRQYNGFADSYEHIPTETLGTLSMPILLVWGDRDRYFPLHMPLELYNALPNAELWVVPGQKHVPIFTEMGGDPHAAAQFVRLAKNLFRKHSAAIVGN